MTPAKKKATRNRGAPTEAPPTENTAPAPTEGDAPAAEQTDPRDARIAELEAALRESTDALADAEARLDAADSADATGASLRARLDALAEAHGGGEAVLYETNRPLPHVGDAERVDHDGQRLVPAGTPVCVVIPLNGTHPRYFADASRTGWLRKASQ